MALLNFDEERFLGIQRGAVGLADDLVAIAEKAAGGATRNVFFLAAGGAGILLEPAYDLLARSCGLPVFWHRPADLAAAGSVHLGPDSLVLSASLSGTTPDTIAALDLARRAGADIVSLTGHAATPIADAADISLVAFAADDTSCESFYLQSLIFALALLRARDERHGVTEILDDLIRMPEALLAVKRQAEPTMPQLIHELGDEDYHVFSGSHSTWPETHYFAMCILEEMQWIRTRPVAAADFFHGTLELVEPGVSVVLLKGEDEGRALVERVERFARGKTEKVTVFDSAEYDLPGISPATRALVSPVVLATVLERFSAHLEVHRDHPLTTRRYYRREDY